MENQQVLLRSAMQALHLTRKEFAAKLGCSERILAAYLLPHDSKGFRNMLPPVEHQVMSLLREQDLARQYGMSHGTIDLSVPAIVCPVFNFRFPTLYRVQGDSFFKGYPCVGTTISDRLFTLSDNTTRQSGVRNPRITPLARRTKKTDQGWVIINEHRNYDRADAYMYGVSQTTPGDTMSGLELCTFEGRIFTLIHCDAPRRALYDCVTIYRSDAYEKTITINQPQQQGEYQDKDIWQMVFGPDGKPLDEEGDLFIEDEIDLSALVFVQGASHE